MNEKLKSVFTMIIKASAGAALVVIATSLTSVDFGPSGNAIAIVVSQIAVHILDKYKLRP